MKNSVSRIITLIFLVTLFFSSCKKTESAAPSTTSTSTTPSGKFVGNWYDSENSSNSTNTYQVVIEAPNTSTILFTNLYGFHVTKISANISNNNFTIPSQIVEGNNVSGSGVLTTPNQINMTFVVDNGLNSDNVTAVLTK